MKGRSRIFTDLLPFPLKKIECVGGPVDVYVIPDEAKQEVLNGLYLFSPVPSLDDEMYDIHEGKTFRVRDFMVTREGGNNMLVSPYYCRSGGTLIDWEPCEEPEEWEKIDI